MVIKTRKGKQSYTIYDMYNAYIKQDNAVEVSRERFNGILELFNKLILETIQDASECFKMPCGLGYVCVVKYRPKTYTSKSLSVDYKASNEYGKRIYHLNEHSDGYKYRLYWSKLPRTMPVRYKYSLVFVRTNKRRLAQLIFKHNDYIDVNDIQVYKL